MEGVPKEGGAMGPEVVAVVVVAGAPPNEKPGLELPPPPPNSDGPAVPKAGAAVAEGAAAELAAPPNENGDAVLPAGAPAASAAVPPNEKGLAADACEAPLKEDAPNTGAVAAGVVVSVEVAAGFAPPMPNPPKAAGVEL